MHFEILVEDESGKNALAELLPRILSDDSTFRIHAYKGIGSIPKGLKDPKDASKRILLQNLPKLLRGYGKAIAQYKASVIVVCDLDDRDREQFLGELRAVAATCDPAPECRFCLAIEEGEAWLLGDLPAVKKAYPRAKAAVLSTYVNDSVCGTWELLADAVFPGGSKELQRLGWVTTGAEKSTWAIKISRHMLVEENRSPSFCQFRDTLRSFASG